MKKKGNSQYITVMDIGSDTLRAIIVDINNDEKIEIKGYASESSVGLVERGWIVQSAHMGQRIAGLLRTLANKVGVDNIASVFVCMGGQMTQMNAVYSVRDQVRKLPINNRLIDDMVKECEQKAERRNEGIGVIEAVPFDIEVDGKEYELPYPEDLRGRRVKLDCFLFCTRKEYMNEYKKSFVQAMKVVEHQFFRPDVLLSLYGITEGVGVFQAGCGVLDMGAQTTNLTLFKGSEYLYTKTFPRGGMQITAYIAQQGISMVHAEEVKCRFGYADVRYVDRDARIKIPRAAEYGGDYLISKRELADMISVKLGEILSPVLEVISEYQDVIKTLYITGGGSMLRGMDEYLRERLPLNVVYGSHNSLLSDKSDEMFFEPRFSSLIGMVCVSREYRRDHEDKMIKKTRMEIFKEGIISIFTTDPQNS